MTPRTETLTSPLTIVGPGATIDKPTAQQQIGALWGQAAQQGALAGDGPTYGVYDAYEDKLAKRYRVTVGQAAAGDPGEGLTMVTVPAGTYVVFEDRGPASEVAARLWHQVWTTWPDRDRRTFVADFERYEGGPDDVRLSLYIGVKPQ